MYASADSIMDGIATPDTNFGTWGLGEVGAEYAGGSKSRLWRAIANFDVSALAGQAVQVAQLERYVETVGGGGFGAKIYRCTRPATWTESGVTWNKYDGVNAWTAAGGDFDSSVPAPVGYAEALVTGWHTVYGLEDVLADALANRGGTMSVIMKADDEAPSFTHVVRWKARDVANPWLLRVTYGGAPAPGRRALTGEAEMLAGLRGVRPRTGVQPHGGVREVAPVGGVR